MDAINWHTFFFLLFALAACWFAVAVVVAANIVRMAFYLVLSLGAVAGLFFLAGADFVGALQLMIYVGGTLVLLVFGVMLTAKPSQLSLGTGGGQWVLAAVVGASLLAVLLQAAFSVRDWTQPPAAAGFPPHKTATPLGLAMLGVRADQPEAGDAADLCEGRPGPVGAWPAAPPASGLAGYLLPFEIISVHLLVVLVGAAFLARARHRARGAPEEDAAEEPTRGAAGKPGADAAGKPAG